MINSKRFVFLTGLLILLCVTRGFGEKMKSSISNLPRGRIMIQTPSQDNQFDEIVILRKEKSEIEFQIARKIQPGMDENFIDENLKDGQNYDYKIEYYSQGTMVRSELFNRTADATPPDPPAALLPEPEFTDDDFNWVGWEASPSDDVLYYWVLWNDQPNTNVPNPDDPSPENIHKNIQKDMLMDKINYLETGKKYYFFVKAVDASGNESAWAGPVSSTQTDKANGFFTIHPREDASVLLEWEPGPFKDWFTNNLTKFQLYRSTNMNNVVAPGNLLADDLDLNTAQFTDTKANGLINGQRYYYKLVGVDQSMVESFDMKLMASKASQGYTADDTPPCEPYFTVDPEWRQYDGTLNLRVFFADSCPVKADSFNVCLSLEPDTNIQFLWSTGFQEAAFFLPPNGKKANMTAMADEINYQADLKRQDYCGVYYYTLKAKDASGNETSYIPFRSVNTDQTNSGIPKNLSAASMDDGAIRLDWGEAEDDCSDLGLSYIIYRSSEANDPNPDSIGVVQALTYTDNSNLRLGGYYYYVRSVDLAGNQSINRASVVGYCNKSPLITNGNGCTSELETELYCEDIDDRLFGAEDYYWFQVARDANFNDIVTESGWTNLRSYPMDLEENTRFYVRAKAKLEKGNDVVLETSYSRAYWAENNSAIPDAVTNLRASCDEKGNIVVKWDKPGNMNSDCNELSHYNVYIYSAKQNHNSLKSPIRKNQYVDYPNSIDCNDTRTYTITAVNVVGKEGNKNVAPTVTIQPAAIPDWDYDTEHLGAINLEKDSLFYSIYLCEDSVLYYTYQFSLDRDFEDKIINYYKLDNTPVDTFVTGENHIVVPEDLELECDSLFVRVKAHYDNEFRESEYSQVLALLVDTNNPLEPKNLNVFYVSGQANVYWDPSSDDCSGVSHYEVSLNNYEFNTVFTVQDTFVGFDTLEAHCPLIGDTTSSHQFDLRVFAYDRAGNKQEGERILIIDSRPKPPVAPVMVYNDMDRYYIEPETGFYFSKGDSHRVYLTYKLDFSDLDYYEFYLETALDSEFVNIYDTSGWKKLDMVPPEQAPSDTAYYFHHSFGAESGHPKLNVKGKPRQNFHYRVKVRRLNYNDSSVWSNHISCIQDNDPPRFNTAQGSGSILYYTKRPMGKQYLDWSNYPVKEEGSGFKYYIIEGSLDENFSNIDTVMEFSPEIQDIIISHTGKGGDEEIFNYFYRFKLYDYVNNVYTSSVIETEVNDQKALMNVTAWDTTSTFDPKEYTKSSLAKIDIFCPDLIGSIKVIISDSSFVDPSDPENFDFPGYVDTIQYDNVYENELEYIDSIGYYRYIDSLNLVQIDYGANLPDESRRFITAILRDKKGYGIDTVSGDILFDKTAPETIDKQIIKMSSYNTQEPLNNVVNIKWKSVADINDKNGENSKLHAYYIYRSTQLNSLTSAEPITILSMADYEYPFNGKLTFMDETVEDETKYYYLICPVDSSNNIQAASPYLEITTDFSPPAQPQVEKLAEFVKSEDYKISVSEFSDDSKKIKIDLSFYPDFDKVRHSSGWKSITEETFIFDDIPSSVLTDGQTYYASVQLRDQHNNQSPVYYTIGEGDEDKIVATIDDVPPEAVEEAMAVPEDESVKLQWKKVFDNGDNGSGIVEYRIYRSGGANITEEDLLTVLNVDDITVDTNSIYTYMDEWVEEDSNYYYKVVSVDAVGWDTFDEAKLITVDDNTLARVNRKIPDKFALRNNFPNPFNPHTVISFDLPSGYSGHVKLEVYNLLGEKVKTLIDKNLDAGYYQVKWNGRNDHGKAAASGVYFYRIDAGEHRQSSKMLLIK